MDKWDSGGYNEAKGVTIFMDNKSILVLFFVFILVFVLAFTLATDAITNSRVLYGIYAFVGFALLVGLSTFEGMTLRKEGVALAYWFRILAIASLIVLVWYCTRLGTLFGWW
mgnify:CR=1 FL=1|jgi:hypothetical protein